MSASRSHRPPDGVRVAFFAVLVLWLVVPLAIRDNLAQDAVPFVAAGELARDDADVIYAPHASNLYDLAPAFSARSCALAPEGTDCSSFNVAFVSPPQALVIAYPLSLLGSGGAVLVFRLVGAAGAALGMLLLWRRLADRTPQAGALLLVTALLLTPFLMNVVALGQTSTLLFASAALGVGGRDERWAKVLGIAALLAVAIVLKLFPVALIAFLVWKQRWRIAAAVVGLLVALSALGLTIAPASSYGRFVETTRTFNAFADTNPYNGALVAVANAVSDTFAVSSFGSAALLGVRLVIGVGAWWLVVRRCPDDDAQWAWSWLLLLFFVPVVWAHYLWIAVGAVGVTLAARRDLDDRRLLVLPGLAAVLAVVGVAASGSGTGLPVVRALLLVGLAVGGWWIVPRASRSARVI